MYNKKSQKKLSVKDLVTCGIFSALFFVFTIIGGILFAPNPVLTFLMPAAVALLTGPIYLLLIAKTKKSGATIILGIIMGLLNFVTGMYWMWSLFYVILGIIANFISSAGNFRNKTLNYLSFIIFSLNPMGSYIMLWINRESYFNYLVEKGTAQSYVDVMGSTAQFWMLPAMILSILITAYISCILGQKLLKKQFEKAGIVA